MTSKILMPIDEQTIKMQKNKINKQNYVFRNSTKTLTQETRPLFLLKGKIFVFNILESNIVRLPHVTL